MEQLIFKQPELPFKEKLKKWFFLKRHKIDRKLKEGCYAVIVKDVDTEMAEILTSNNLICWEISVQEVFEARGSFNGLLGYVTQYENQSSVDIDRRIYGESLNKPPWIRITFHYDSKTGLPLFHHSVTMNADVVMVIQDETYIELAQDRHVYSSEDEELLLWLEQHLYLRE